MILMSCERQCARPSTLPGDRRDALVILGTGNVHCTTHTQGKQLNWTSEKKQAWFWQSDWANFASLFVIFIQKQMDCQLSLTVHHWTKSNWNQNWKPIWQGWNLFQFELISVESFSKHLIAVSLKNGIVAGIIAKKFEPTTHCSCHKNVFNWEALTGIAFHCTGKFILFSVQTQMQTLTHSQLPWTKVTMLPWIKLVCNWNWSFFNFGHLETQIEIFDRTFQPIQPKNLTQKGKPKHTFVNFHCSFANFHLNFEAILHVLAMLGLIQQCTFDFLNCLHLDIWSTFDATKVDWLNLICVTSCQSERIAILMLQAFCNQFVWQKGNCGSVDLCVSQHFQKNFLLLCVLLFLLDAIVFCQGVCLLHFCNAVLLSEQQFIMSDASHVWTFCQTLRQLPQLEYLQNQKEGQFDQEIQQVRESRQVATVEHFSIDNLCLEVVFEKFKNSSCFTFLNL